MKTDRKKLDLGLWSLNWILVANRTQCARIHTLQTQSMFSLRRSRHFAHQISLTKFIPKFALLISEQRTEKAKWRTE